MIVSINPTRFHQFQITNGCNVTSKGTLSKIEVFKNPDDSQPIWEAFLGSTIRCIAANRKVIIACCDDLTINCYYVKSSARAWPSITIEDLVVSLSLTEESMCLVLTKTGLMHLWDFESRKSLLNRISIRSLLTNKASVSGCSLTNSNQPLITLTDGRAYSYSLDFQSW